MRAQFLNDGSDFRSRGGGSYTAKGRRDDSLFWWTILITLLIGVATFCWFFSIMVFKYPEKPFNYKLLTKLKKLDPLAKFDPLASVAVKASKVPDDTPVQRLPNGTFHNARDLLNKYYNYNRDQLRLTNALLKRSYIMNYSGESPVYVKGTFAVASVRRLTSDDLMSNGWVVRARSVDLEDVELEFLLPMRSKSAPTPVEEAEPAAEESEKTEAAAGDKVAAAEKEEAAKEEVPKAIPVVEAPYHEGEVFTLDNKKSFCSVINILRNQDADGLCATVVPISYGTFDLGNQKALALAPPPALKVDAPLPVTGTEPSPPADSKVAAQQATPGTATAP
jgi:hypothetical protein